MSYFCEMLMKAAAPALNGEDVAEFCQQVPHPEENGEDFGIFEYAAKVAAVYEASEEGAVGSFYSSRSEVDRYAETHGMPDAHLTIWRGIDYALMYRKAYDGTIGAIRTLALQDDPKVDIMEARIGEWDVSYGRLKELADDAVYFFNATPHASLVSLHGAIRAYSIPRVKQCYREVRGIHDTVSTFCHPAIPYLLACIDTLNPNLGEMAIHEEKLTSVRGLCKEK